MKRVGIILVGIILWTGISAQVQTDSTNVAVNDSIIEIYYGDKLENTIKLEDNTLNIYDKTGILEASVSETEDSVKITENKKNTEIKVNNQTIEVFESNKKKSIASYNIVAM